jgi:choline-sulfatase
VLPVELYPDVWLTGRAVERIADLPSDRPWLLWVSFVGPHEPFDTPAPWAGRHRAAPLPRPVPEPPWIRSLPAHAATRRTRERWEGLVTPDAIDACRRDYADHLSLLDDQVGRLVRAVEGRSDASRTAVAVTGDHGELLGDAGMLYKGTFLEGAVRVPWIHRPPPGAALPASATCARPLGVTALLGACLAHLAAGSAADDLMAWAEGAPDVCCEFEDELMIVDGPRKLVVDGKGRPLWATDLDRDPHEQENVITQLRAAWRADPGWRRLREMAHAQFRLRKRRGWTWRRLEDVR